MFLIYRYIKLKIYTKGPTLGTCESRDGKIDLQSMRFFGNRHRAPSDLQKEGTCNEHSGPSNVYICTAAHLYVWLCLVLQLSYIQMNEALLLLIGQSLMGLTPTNHTLPKDQCIFLEIHFEKVYLLGHLEFVYECAYIHA